MGLVNVLRNHLGEHFSYHYLFYWVVYQRFVVHAVASMVNSCLGAWHKKTIKMEVLWQGSEKETMC